MSDLAYEHSVETEAEDDAALAVEDPAASVEVKSVEPESVEQSGNREEELLAELEHYRESVRALTEAGLIEPPKPGEPGYDEAAYADHLNSQLEAAREERREILQQLAALTGADVLPYEVDEFFAQDFAEWKGQQQAIGDHLDGQAQEQRAQTEERVSELIESRASEIGAEGIDVADVMDITERAFVELTNRYGPEVAAELAPQVLTQTIEYERQQIETGLSRLDDTARRMVRTISPNADPQEVVDLAHSLYPRALHEANGNTAEAIRESLDVATRHVAGLGEGRAPINASLAAYHSERARAFRDLDPPTEAPKMETKVERNRDVKTGQFLPGFKVKPLAEKYARNDAPKSVFEPQDDAITYAVGGEQ